VFLNQVENQYCAKHGRLPVMKPERILTNNVIPSSTASGSVQCFFDPYHFSSNDEEYLTPKNVAEVTPA